MLIVVLYHAKVGLFSAGFLGVDVFFVISGFLITRVISDGIDQKQFSFANFYFRRAKRLLPAAYVTFLFTTACAPLLLASSEMRDLRGQLIGAVTFTSNFILWLQSGYFGGGASLKPLLHVWSLSLEEQYYFVLPIALVLLPRRHWIRGAILVITVSIGITFLRAGRDSTFYLLPSRAWELGFGSIGALLIRTPAADRVIRSLFWPALLVLIGLPMVLIGSAHPGVDALLICGATLIVILRAHPLLVRGALPSALGSLGNMSYSLYLVHWPIFAFFENAVILESTPHANLPSRLGLVALSFAGGWALNRWVEDPVRNASVLPTGRFVATTLVSSGLLIVLAFAVPRLSGGPVEFQDARQLWAGLAKACDATSEFVARPECRTSEAPEMLLWGDSFAMHLTPALMAVPDGPVPFVQATRTACGPLLGLASLSDHPESRAWAMSCVAFNESVLEYLRRTPSIGVVVLSSPFTQFTFTRPHVLRQRADGGGYEELPGGIEVALSAIKATVDSVRALGRRVIVVAPPPSGGFDMGRCVERARRGLPILGTATDCTYSYADYRSRKGAVIEFLEALPTKVDVEVVSFDSLFCDAQRCRSQIDGVIMFRDGGHFSPQGIRLAAARIGMIEAIKRRAR